MGPPVFWLISHIFVGRPVFYQYSYIFVGHPVQNLLETKVGDDRQRYIKTETDLDKIYN